MNMTDAERLAVCFHGHYQRHLKLQKGHVVNASIPPFDRKSPDGRAAIFAMQELMASGELVAPQIRGVVSLIAFEDGRRSRANLPDRLTGWQFMGQLDREGKVCNVPDWAADKIRRGRDGWTVLKTTLSIMPKQLLAGDWVVLEDTGIHADRPRLFSLTAAQVARWYTVG